MSNTRVKLVTAAALGALLLAACEEAPAPKPETQPKSAASASGKGAESAKPEVKKDTTEAKTEPKKLDSAGLEALADAVKFEQGAVKDKGWSGKLTNGGEAKIGMLDYRAFAYGKDDKLIEMIKGKHPSALEPGKSADIEVGPFTKAAGKADVTVEVVVSWMNVDGTSWQRPVPDDRKKGGPNSALAK